MRLGTPPVVSSLRPRLGRGVSWPAWGGGVIVAFLSILFGQPCARKKIMKRTPLFEGHHVAGGRLVDFAGWEMPMQYTGVVDEYQTVRTTAGLFDVSHMGRIVVSGDGALSFLQRMTTNNVAKLGVLESQYSMICNETGGIKDDIFVYRKTPQEYLLCVNASNREKIAGWLSMQASGANNVTLHDRSGELAQLALPGPCFSGHSFIHGHCWNRNPEVAGLS